MGKQVYIPEEKIKFNKFKSTLNEHLHLARQYTRWADRSEHKHLTEAERVKGSEGGYKVP